MPEEEWKRAMPGDEFVIPASEETANAQRLVREVQERAATIRQRIEQELQEAAQEAHVHQWAIMGVWNPPIRTPIHPRLAVDMPYTVVLLKCRECEWPETTQLEGVWTEDQVRGATDDRPGER
jgi:hypothetical protein